MQSPVEARNGVRKGWHTALPEAAWLPPHAMQRPWFLLCRGSQGAGHDGATVCAGSSLQQSWAQLLGPTSLQHFVLPLVVTSPGSQCCCLWHPCPHGSLTHNSLGCCPSSPHTSQQWVLPHKNAGVQEDTKRRLEHMAEGHACLGQLVLVLQDARQCGPNLTHPPGKLLQAVAGLVIH